MSSKFVSDWMELLHISDIDSFQDATVETRNTVAAQENIPKYSGNSIEVGVRHRHPQTVSLDLAWMAGGLSLGPPIFFRVFLRVNFKVRCYTDQGFVYLVKAPKEEEQWITRVEAGGLGYDCVYYEVIRITRERFNIELQMFQYQAEWVDGSNSWVIAADLHHAPDVGVAKRVRACQPSTDSRYGEEAESDPEVAEMWIGEKLSEILQNYKNANIFNCNETGSYCRFTPRKTLLNVGQRMKGGKKKKLLVFAKSKLDFERAGFTWANNKKAWITQAVFTLWLKELNEKMKRQKHNASGHKVASLSHVKLVFLPPKQTNRIQPLDQGIIKAFQSHESAAKAEHRREKRKNFRNLEDYKKFLTVLHSVKWIMKAWSEVDASTKLRGKRHNSGIVVFHS
ncbi:hypothetical protein RvY_16141 [Ramazzottius varieornatus]|uniref:DDE-1 domain-containing protein n=1 Tax=Ramazzottius varieornatus TaxID=947166 RepID=A0A1D1W569_RAMVA|nr:hypothetical protein RvY_16141 [Ramazzottius varieornatus]